MTYFIETWKGGRFHFGDASKCNFNIATVAHHLSLVNRYCGATEDPWSVAEHSLLVADLVEENGGDACACFHALIHDRHEFAMNDLNTPFEMWFEEEFAPDEMRLIAAAKMEIDDVIDEVLGITHLTSGSINPLVKQMDTMAFYVESANFFNPIPDWWNNQVAERYGIKHFFDDFYRPLHNRPHKDVREEFINRFNDYMVIGNIKVA